MVEKTSRETKTSIVKSSLSKGLKNGVKSAVTVAAGVAIDMIFERLEQTHSKQSDEN